MVNFWHRLLRRIAQRVSLPGEDEWDSLKCFDFSGKEFFTNEQFLVKRSFKPCALTLVKNQIDVERNEKTSG